MEGRECQKNNMAELPTMNGSKGWLTPQTITSAGGVVIALVIIYLGFGLLRDNFNQINASLRDINKTLQEVARATEENVQATSALRDIIKRQ